MKVSWLTRGHSDLRSSLSFLPSKPTYWGSMQTSEAGSWVHVLISLMLYFWHGLCVQFSIFISKLERSNRSFSLQITGLWWNELVYFRLLGLQFTSAMTACSRALHSTHSGALKSFKGDNSWYFVTCWLVLTEFTLETLYVLSGETLSPC